MMTAEQKILLAHAMARLAEPEAMDRAQMVKTLQDGSSLTEQEANEVIVHSLHLALLVEDPTNPTRLRGVPKLRPRW